MASSRFANIGELRRTLFSLRSASLADAAGLSRGRLAEIEKGESFSIFEAERLGEALGIEGDLLLEQPIELSRGDGIPLLASLDEFRELGDLVRLRVIRAAAAVRDAKKLQAINGEGDLLRLFRTDERPQKPRHPQPNPSPFRVGASWAAAARMHLQIGKGPLSSLRDLCATQLPSLSIFYSRLGREGPAALCLTDAMRGPAIILNLEGKNENPLVLRFSFAHELCHAFFDWTGHQPLMELSGYKLDNARDRESRANAFAIRFLCPEAELKQIVGNNSGLDAARTLMKDYGIHYGASRLYLKNECAVEVPSVPPSDLSSTSVLADWNRREQPTALDAFPLAAVPPERRTIVAEEAARAYSTNLIGRDEFCRLLGQTPVADVERVLDFLGLPEPDDSTDDEAAA